MIKLEKIPFKGGVQYRLHNLLHREDGPAVETTNRQEWWLCGKCHRDDGPAIVYTDGRKEWHKHGRLQHKQKDDVYPEPAEPLPHNSSRMIIL